MAGEPPGLLSVRRLAGPLLSGMLLAAATPPAASPILPFFVLTPLAVHLARLPAESGGVRAFESGALAVLVQHGWGLRWLPWTMGAVAGTAIGWTAFATVLLTLASLGGVASWCVRRLSTGPRALPLALALAIGWTALEWTLAHLPFGLAFPWAPIGLGLVTWPQALGLAELVGVTGVTCWLALVSGLLATAMIGWKGEPTGFNRISARIPARLRAMALATGVVLVVGPVLWGARRARSLVTRPVAHVVALALDVPPAGPSAARAEASVSAVEGALASGPSPVDLVVLPEMVLPLEPGSTERSALVRRLRTQADGLAAPLLVGAVTTSGGRFFNSALLVTESVPGTATEIGDEPDGERGVEADPGASAVSEPTVVAHKRRLVPGVERGNTLAPGWLAPATATGYTPGEVGTVLAVGSLRAGVLICYDVAFAEDARRLLRGGANTLVALSSDAWFGGTAGARRAGAAQHIAHLTLRAIETRTGAVRSANGGPAVSIDPAGRVLTVGPTGALTAPVSATAEPTSFARTGDLVGPGAALLLVLALLTGRARGRPGGGTGRTTSWARSPTRGLSARSDARLDSSG